MDYPCAKFGDFSFSLFGFIVRTDSQNHTQNHKHTDADDRYTHATESARKNKTDINGI